MAMTEEDVMAWDEVSEALEESREEWSYVMAGETIDKVGVVEFLEKTIERCNSPVEQQKLHEILAFCQEHTFGEGVEV